jgi:hypothetical protein
MEKIRKNEASWLEYFFYYCCGRMFIDVFGEAQNFRGGCPVGGAARNTAGLREDSLRCVSQGSATCL